MSESEPVYSPWLYPIEWAQVSHDRSDGSTLKRVSPRQTEEPHGLYAHGTGKVRVNLHPDPSFPKNDCLNQDWNNIPVVGDDILLVSHGEKNDNCGDVRAKLFCETTKKFVHDLRHSCHRPECPICWIDWVDRETSRAAEKLYQGRKLLKQSDRYYDPYHIVWSVPPSEYGLTPKQQRTRLNYRMKQAGATAGFTVYHQFRFRNRYTNESVAWKHCSLNPLAESPVVDSEAYYSPHFHTACVGFLEPSKDFESKYGWRYTKMDKNPLNNMDKMRQMIWYSLSHATTMENMHVVTWTGKFANNQMLVDSIEYVTEYPKCPCCKGRMEIEYQPNDWFHYKRRELYLVTITKRHYKFKAAFPNRSYLLHLYFQHCHWRDRQI